MIKMRWYNEGNKMKNEIHIHHLLIGFKSLSLFVMQEHDLHKGQYLK